MCIGPKGRAMMRTTGNSLFCTNEFHSVNNIFLYQITSFAESYRCICCQEMLLGSILRMELLKGGRSDLVLPVHEKNSQNSPTCSWEGWRRLKQDYRAHLKRSASDNSSFFLLLVLMLSLSLYTSQRFLSNTLYTMICLSLFKKDRTLSKRDFQQDWGVPVSSMALVSCFHCFNKSCSSLRS